jgi:hypothetical protein
MKERVCRLQLLLVLASAVILEPESHGTHDHILLSQIQSQVMLQPTVQSASLSWNKAPIWGLRPDLYYCQLQAS